MTDEQVADKYWSTATICIFLAVIGSIFIGYMFSSYYEHDIQMNYISCVREKSQKECTYIDSKKIIDLVNSVQFNDETKIRQIKDALPR